MALAVTCSNEEKVKVTAAPTTGAGSPAEIDGMLTIEVQSGDGTYTQDPADPLSFYAVSGTALGDTIYKVSADADLGEGIVTIEDLVTLTVTGALAKSMGLTAGEPEEKVATEPPVEGTTPPGGGTIPPPTMPPALPKK